MGAHGGGGRAGVECRGQAAGGAGEVERDRGEHEPGAVGHERPGGQVRHRAALEVGDDLFDDRMRSVGLFGLDQRQRAVAEHGVVPVGREQLLLLGDGAVAGARLGLGVAGGVEALDAAHDQPAGDVLCLASAGERDEGHLGDLGVGDQPLLLVVPDRVRIPDRGPGVLVDAGDRRADSWVHPGGDREPHLRPAGGRDHTMVVEGTVGAQHHQPGAVQPASAGGLRGLERVGDQPGRTTGRVGAALTQPGRADHRSGQRSRHDRDQRVQALHPGVAEPGALLGVAVGRPDRVIDIDVGDLVGTGQQRCPTGELGQHGGRDTVELADMTESERAQERAHRRGGPDPAEQPVHPAVPQQVHVINAVRPSDHPRDQPRDLQVRVRATPGGQRQLGCDQLGQAATLRQRDHRRQPSARHQVRIVEHRRHLAGTVRKLHSADAPSVLVPVTLDKPHSPCTAGHPRSTTCQTALLRRWIQAQTPAGIRRCSGGGCRSLTGPVRVLAGCGWWRCGPTGRCWRRSC